MSSTPGGEGEHGWQKSDVVDDIRSWFCSLSTHERLRALAVEDVIWIRLFNILYRKHKSWIQQGGRPPTWDKDKVQKIYDRLQRNEMNRAGAGGLIGAASPASPTSRSVRRIQSSSPSASPQADACPPSVVQGVTGAFPTSTEVVGVPDTLEPTKNHTVRGGKESKAQSSRGGSVEVKARFVAQQLVPDVCSTSVGKTVSQRRGTKHSSSGKPGETDEAAEAVEVKTGAGSQGGVKGRERDAFGGEDEGEGEVDPDSVLRAVERLQEAVRLCCVARKVSGGGCLSDTLTLSEEELSEPHQLLASLQLCSSWGNFGGRDGHGGNGVGRERGGFLSRPLAESDARRAALQPAAAPLHETTWLASKVPGATLGDLLANRLELSLWGSYWKRSRSMRSSTTGTSTGCTKLSALLEEVSKLSRYWKMLPLTDRLWLLEGLPEAQAAASRRAAGGKTSSDSQGEQIGADSHDDMRDLLFTPVSWCYKDDGAAVRLAVERIRTSCADGVTEEVREPGVSGIGDEGKGAVLARSPSQAMNGEAGSGGGGSGSGDGSPGEGKGKSKKSRRRRKKGLVDVESESVNRKTSNGVVRAGAFTEEGKALSEDAGKDSEDDKSLMPGEVPPGRTFVDVSSATGSRPVGDMAEGELRTENGGDKGVSETPPAAVTISDELNSDGWMVSTSRRKPKDNGREEGSSRRARGGGGGSGNKPAKDNQTSKPRSETHREHRDHREGHGER
ncbi:unnamed protein product, partial [Choristocarpus tenellus]